MKSRRLLIGILLFPIMISAAAAEDQRPSTDDPELDRVEAMIRQAWQEHEEHIKKGGKATDLANPARKWIETLWERGQKDAATKASARARSESLHLMAHLGMTDEMHRRADTFKPDDPVWQHALNPLWEGAEESGNYDYLLGKAKLLVEQSPDKEIRARAQMVVGRAHWKKGNLDQAKAAFQSVIAGYPDTPYAKDAEGNIIEIELLNTGQPAPLFAGKTIRGESLGLWNFRGKVVLLNFWASW